jgi:hypothetical protein
LLNFIEILTFLNENAIFVLHDILWHFDQKSKLCPSNVYLYPVIYGDKVLLKNEDGSIPNTGAIFLYNNQEKHYLEYFLLLLACWEYIPKDNHINELRKFIKDFYKKGIYLKISYTAVIKNKTRIKNIKNKENSYFRK